MVDDTLDRVRTKIVAMDKCNEDATPIVNDTIRKATTLKRAIEKQNRNYIMQLAGEISIDLAKICAMNRVDYKYAIDEAYYEDGDEYHAIFNPQP